MVFPSSASANVTDVPLKIVDTLQLSPVAPSTAMHTVGVDAPPSANTHPTNSHALW